MAAVILYLMIMIWVIVMFVLKRASSGSSNAVRRNGLPRPSESDAVKWLAERMEGKKGPSRRPRSTDGHFLSKEQDITCRKFGHDHPEWEEPSTRYIVHDDIEDGYIILNGKKMLRTEADAYENTI
ncbi:MAG TPA: hypothetical protein DCF49_01030 [Lachnospiraceae bacterium]|nr:hypothetical protein [Lachnospiraceae bacterium]